MKNFRITFSLLMLLSSFAVNAQNDTMYIMKAGVSVGVYIVNDIDSIIFYKPEGYVPTIEDIEGNSYPIITLGTQVWMAENLKTTRYSDGSYIPLITDAAAWAALTSDAYCYYDNDEETNGSLYGALYNWAAVNTGMLCPSGWHVPSDPEWKQLEMYLGMDEAVANTAGYRGVNEGSKIAGNAELWYDGLLEADPQFALTEFNAIPGGSRNESGNFGSISLNAYWWTSTEGSLDYAFMHALSFNETNILRLSKLKYNALSVRCIKDSE